MYYAYVLFSPSFQKIYIGHSNNPEGRLIAHNHPKNKGWTKRYQPWNLVHYELFNSKSEAIKREKQLKSFKGREFIWEKIIRATN